MEEFVLELALQTNDTLSPFITICDFGSLIIFGFGESPMIFNIIKSDHRSHKYNYKYLLQVKFSADNCTRGWP